MATAAAPARNPLSDWIVPIAAVSLVFVMLVPLPGVVLDLLLATSIAASVLVLLSALQILRPAQFSVFPSLLLLLTLFRLSLNLASSRRILLHGNEGSAAAGRVIEAFGQFVVGGNYVVGFVLFLALIAIQYIVVSHGAVRTAEVTARFTLDALPGKQMAIDADLNAGLIDENQARARREQVAREAEFYGAMDGAARFNQRDSIATILITGINILAGFLIGVFQLDIPFREALKTYTVLTVGDGLVTMIPSLLVSMAGGMVVTRASSGSTLSIDLGTQLLSRRRPLQIASGVMFALALIPGLPKFSFLTLGALVAFLATRLPATGTEAAKEAAIGDPGAPASGDKEKKAAKSDSIEDLLKLDELSLEVGYGLVPLVDAQQGGQLLARVKALRSNLACSSDSSSLPFTSRTMCGSSHANTRFRCVAWKSPAGKCSKTAYWRSARRSRLLRWRARRRANPHSESPPSGFSARSNSRRWPAGMPSSIRPRCSRLTLPS